ncbi:MAG TPA: methylenetetrahydrofolate reductase [NAD(P)H] [Bacillota bacterium]|nr:methylenetetrahydrofolate reductase [NAD(P)H] [Bacillota bacterium]
MYIKELFRRKKPVLSFEIFPPKPDYPLETVFETVKELRDLNPDFMSVTYGAGGSNRERTVQIASRIKQDFQVETMAHLTCVGHSPVELDAIIEDLKINGIENILALRGDPPQNSSTDFFQPGHYCHAIELIQHIQKNKGFCIGGAAYPEGHVECRRLDEDWGYLGDKVAAGVDFLVTQLFFDNRAFYHFKESLLRLGVTVPVSAGIMPVLNSKQIRRMAYLSGASIPAKLLRIFDSYENDPVAFEQAGIEYAIGQINDLIENGVEGIHLYTMNRAVQTRQIVANIDKKFD